MIAPNPIPWGDQGQVRAWLVQGAQVPHTNDTLVSVAAIAAITLLAIVVIIAITLVASRPMREDRGPDVTEDELMEAVRDLCKLLGLAVFHDYDSRRSWGPGYPDLTIVGNRGVLWRELKSAAGSLSPNQRTWMYRLRAAGQNWALWRPSDLQSGRIAKDLREIA